jgi:hypothetical protein
VRFEISETKCLDTDARGNDKRDRQHVAAGPDQCRRPTFSPLSLATDTTRYAAASPFCPLYLPLNTTASSVPCLCHLAPSRACASFVQGPTNNTYLRTAPRRLHTRAITKQQPSLRSYHHPYRRDYTFKERGQSATRCRTMGNLRDLEAWPASWGSSKLHHRQHMEVRSHRRKLGNCSI